MVRLVKTCGGTRNGDSLGYSCGILHIGKMQQERAPYKLKKKRKKGQRTKGKMPNLKNSK